MVADHLLCELFHIKRLRFLLGELRNLDLIPAAAVHERRNLLVGTGGLPRLAILRPLSKLATRTDRLSRLARLPRLYYLSLLIDLILTRLAWLDDLTLLAGANQARLRLLILLRRCLLSEIHAADAKCHHESDNRFTHHKTPEKWTPRTPRLLRSHERTEFPPAPPSRQISAG
jgi:hypothetical protein